MLSEAVEELRWRLRRPPTPSVPPKLGSDEEDAPIAGVASRRYN